MFFVFQSGTIVKNVYASLANGTLVVFTPKTASTARRCSHNDVTLVQKEEDEQLIRESDKWSNLQVCHLSFIVKGPITQMAGHEIFTPTISSLSIAVCNPSLSKSCQVLLCYLFYSNKFYFGAFDWFLGSFLYHKTQLNIPFHSLCSHHFSPCLRYTFLWLVIFYGQ